MLDEAYDIVVAAGAAMSFMDLMNKVAENLEMSEEEKIARLGAFYTDLSLDGRFVALTNNAWDLRSRHTYDKVHIDVNEVYSDEEGDLDLEEELDEEDRDIDDGEEEDEENESKKPVDLKGTGFENDF